MKPSTVWTHSNPPTHVKLDQEELNSRLSNIKEKRRNKLSDNVIAQIKHIYICCYYDKQWGKTQVIMKLSSDVS